MCADERSNLPGVVYGLLEGAYDSHIRDAETAFGRELVLFLRDVQTAGRRSAERARVMLARRTSAGGV
jgi:hypothetical protein